MYIMYACIRHRLCMLSVVSILMSEVSQNISPTLLWHSRCKNCLGNSLETLKRWDSSLCKRQIQNCTLQYCSTREFFLVTVKILQLDWFIIVFVCSKCMHCRWRDANFRVNAGAMAFAEQRGILIVPYLASFARSHPKERPSSGVHLCLEYSFSKGG